MSTNLNQLILSLPQIDKAKLFEAFEDECPAFIKLPEGKYVGVNVSGPSFVYIEKQGVWSYGDFIDG